MLFDRAALETREAQTLAPYATLSQSSRGRLYPEPESPRRTAFQKDRDRVLHTAAFRRLEYKTQVFLNAQGDHYRTRLTHTLEVAQAARSVALNLGLNETLAETISLAHDLGHPPFGHAGESILDGLAAAHGGFDHNLQTVRIVTELEDRYPDFPGLNLTRETLDGLAKHAHLSSGQHTLEAQLVNVADGLAYSAHDLDDGLRSGLIAPHDLRGLPLWEHLTARLHLDPDHVGEKDRRSIQRELLGWLIDDLTTHSHEQLKAAGIVSPQQVAAHPSTLIAFSPAMHSGLSELNRFLFERLYRHPRVLRQVAQAEHCLESLYRAFLKRPAMLPPGARSRLEGNGLERTVCDHIAGMTDRYALEEYRSLHGIAPELGF
ncbi:deoxyguanosinetriphosphate triphosphohydrolase-like protein 1 [Deinococcus ruber]|uniref:Deoxyguanosinetriphosphate triphosphohydrolase-like protein n=1 Tax=Deinococcus ruber TaxID=1848197 RepID=A0A918BZ22_9DEIO|nr:deoxyguanosinetriphosphate triphosphohydrolase-like protein 1 [Deinococcus ruber]